MHAIWFANFFTLIAIGGVLVFERPMLAYEHLPFRVLNSPVKAGTPVMLRVTRCNRDNKLRTYVVSRTLIGADGGRYVLPASQTSIEPGCITVVSALTVIPIDAPPGKYTLRGYGEINGFIRTHVVQWQSAEFEVAP